MGEFEDDAHGCTQGGGTAVEVCWHASVSEHSQPRSRQEQKAGRRLLI